MFLSMKCFVYVGYLCLKIILWQGRWILFIPLNCSPIISRSKFVSLLLLLRSPAFTTRFPEVLYFAWLCHFRHSWLFELFRLKFFSRLCSVLENLQVDAFVEELILFNLIPIELFILAFGEVLDAEFWIKTDLLEPPVIVALIVLFESKLTVAITLWHLEYLTVEILLLFWDE